MLKTSRRLPSLNALRAFEAAARHLSFTKAADELAVTQGAVSHQVKALEAEIGVQLFHRFRHGLALTTAGQTYLPVVRDAFDHLSFGTKQLLAAEQADRLRICVSPNFAAKWLVPRLGRFTHEHPELDLRICAKENHIDLVLEGVDLAVRDGRGDWPDLHVTELACESLFPVCSPRLLEHIEPLHMPADLQHAPLIYLNHRDDWRKWLEIAGAREVDLSRGIVFDQASLALEAAVDGHGIALARTTLAAGDLLTGRLVRLFAHSLAPDYSYFIVCLPTFADRPKVRSLRTWLLDEALGDTKRLELLWHDLYLK